MIRKTIILCLAGFVIILCSGNGNPAIASSLFPDYESDSLRLFSGDELLEASLQFDLTKYLRTKPKEEFLKAVFTLHLSERDSIVKEIRIKSRGEFRNQNCFFPPMELNIKKADFKYADLKGVSKIKMVTPCNTGGSYENYILREYLIYKMFNVLSDTSFRVRLLRITMIDSEKKKKPMTSFGFLIEPVELLASRTNTVVVRTPALTQKSIAQVPMDRVAIFNYMIGNYDWAVPGQHNIKVLKSLTYDIQALGIAVPYDFDLTGVVDALYAIPAEVIGTKSIRERIFLGVCRTRDDYEDALAEFVAKKDEFFRVINEFPHLNQRSRKDITDYLNEFYKLVNNKQEIIEIFLEKCKKF